MSKLKWNYQILMKSFVIVMTIYILFWTTLSFLMGEQLYQRDSRYNIENISPEQISINMIQGNVVEQKFLNKIQRIDEISVTLATYNRVNEGSIYIELRDALGNNTLFIKEVEAASIIDCIPVVLEVFPEISGYYNRELLLRVYSDNELLDKSVTPVVAREEVKDKLEINDKQEMSVLTYNGQEISGWRLCYGVSGKEDIWIGIHYWKIGIILGLMLCLFFGILFIRLKNEKRSYVFGMLVALEKYKFLIKLLVSRDFKTKYKRSILGMLWSFLNPMLTMAVQYVVFSNLFKSDVENYHIYLLIGIVTFSFFSEACSTSLVSLVGNAGLITKVYLPKYIYPSVKVVSALVNFAFSLVPLLIAIILTGIPLSKSFILILFPIACLFLFSLGLGMCLASAMVFFRDTQFLWGVASMIWLYATPIFYPISIIEEKYRFLFEFNPLYHFIKFIRVCIMDGISPEPISYVICFGFAIFSFVIGIIVFKKTQDKVIYYL